MGWFEVKLPGLGGWVYKFPGSSCVSTQISSTPPPGWKHISNTCILNIGAVTPIPNQTERGSYAHTCLPRLGLFR